MTDGSPSKEDLKAKMRDALARKNDEEKGVHRDGPSPEKVHGGSEVPGGAAPKMHRRKAGGGGS